MKSEKLIIFTLTAAQFTHVMDFMIMMPLSSMLMRLLSISPQQFSFLVSSYTFCAGIVGFLGTFFLDQLDKRKVFLISYVGFVVSTLCFALSESYEYLLFFRMLSGVFGGIKAALILSIISDLVPLQRRGKAIGILMTSVSISAVMGVPIGLYLATQFNWHFPFFLIVIVSILVGAVLFLILPGMKSENKTPISIQNGWKTLKMTFTDRNLTLGLLFTLSMMLGHFTIIPFIADYMVVNVGFTEEQLTYIYLFGGAASIVASPLVGRLADAYGRYRVFVVFGLAAAIPLFLVTHLPQVPLYIALLVTTLFFITSSGRMVPSSTIVTSLPDKANRNSYMSLRASFQNIGLAVASSMAGLIVQKTESGALIHYEIVGYIAIFFSILTVFIGQFLKPSSEEL